MRIHKYDLQALAGVNFKDGVYAIRYYATCPKGQVIRTDYVNDGYYKGYFVWMIVDENDTDFEPTEIQWITPIKDEFVGHYINLGICEQQTVKMYKNPFNLQIHSEKGFLGLSYDTMTLSELEDREVVIYKTGQEIREPINSLQYVGFGRIWIKQELGLFVFIRNNV